ncbi:MAG: ABC transporter permease [Gammaproteobacteria bacterium]|nr:ABC transporter permease [Gammaproteobacteria bacterium]MDD9874519.1 ABC transporter permease [Gammaproteobacteria bacterium]
MFPTRSKRVRRWLAAEPLGMAGALIVGLLLLVALLAPVLSPYPPDAINYRHLLSPPSTEHLLGTDDLGRDILSRLLYGAQLSLSAGISAVILSVLVGVPVGLVAGYAGGMTDELVMRVFDSIIALPPLVLALTISAVLGPGLVNATIAIAIVAVPTYARLIRGQVLSIKNNDYILAARSVGVSSRAVLFRHILPNVISPIIVQAALGVGFAIILESSLSFIGLGAQPPTSTWGSMVQTSFQYLELAPWFVIAPSVAIFVAVLGANLLGEGLRNFLDPNQKKAAQKT